MRLAFLAAAAIAAFLAGCATQTPANIVTLTTTSSPAGAYITETGQSNGALSSYTSEWTVAHLEKFKDNKGCYLVKGLSAKWGSGATARSPDVIKLCGGAGNYTWVLNRDPAHPGLHLDLDFALRYTGQQQQLQAAQAAQEAREEARTNAIVEGLAAGFAGAMDARNARQPVQVAPIRCTSKRTISGSVTTECN